MGVKNNSSDFFLLTIFCTAAIASITRGVLTIARKEGFLMFGNRTRYIATGKHAISAGIGEIIMGLGFFAMPMLMLLDAGWLYPCVAPLIIVGIGVFVHVRMGFNYPDMQKLADKNMVLLENRNNTPMTSETRRKKIFGYAMASLGYGALITASLCAFDWSRISQDFPLYLLGALVWGGFMFLRFLSRGRMR